MPVTTDDALKQILQETKTIALVGHSDKPDRTSYQVAQYLREAGYTVIPVNPMLDEIDGEPCYPNVAAIPQPVDVVDVFRRAEFMPEVVDDAIQAGAKVVWMQLDIEHEEAAQTAEAAGLRVVMDRCMKIEHGRLL